MRGQGGGVEGGDWRCGTGRIGGGERRRGYRLGEKAQGINSSALRNAVADSD